MSSTRPTVTLCMIVKDEEHIIHECLDSMIPYIDRYDITDTGSTDRTKEIIREWGKKNNIPGEVYDHPWQGFGKSRTASLRNADKGGADYAWVIDADDRVTGDFKYPPQFGQHWGYTLKIKRGDFEWWRNQIFKTNVGWQYVGVIHEYADCPGMQEKGGGIARLMGDYAIDARTMGSRTKAFEKEGDSEFWKQKYLADAATLLDCITNPENPNYEPENVRYHFYLAQSYFDGGDFENAKKWYIKRAELGSWEEEQWYSVLRVAMCMSNLSEDWAKVQDVFLKAYSMRPSRSEPLYHLARIHRLNGNPKLGYLFSKMACSIPFPIHDVLFVAKDLYDWQVFDELASTAWYTGDMVAGLMASNKLLSERKYPEAHHERILNNWRQYSKFMEDQEEKKKQAEQQRITAQIEQQESEKNQRMLAVEKREQEKKINKRRQKDRQAKQSRKARR